MNCNELECPKCGEWIEIPDFAVSVTCLDCQESWIVDHDAEFVDGMWRDRTQLIAQQVALAQEVSKNPGLQIVLESFAKHLAPTASVESGMSTRKAKSVP